MPYHWDNSGFDKLSTNSINNKMRPIAERIYRMVWPGCTIRRPETDEELLLDKKRGIDAYITLPQSGAIVTIQEKFRDHKALQWTDFTQEYMNAAGTPYQAPGEWFHLHAQYYMYGFADKLEIEFEKWAILNVGVYKMWVEREGGLDRVGVLRSNREHGRASFYAIPLNLMVQEQGLFYTDYKCYKLHSNSVQRPFTTIQGTL